MQELRASNRPLYWGVIEETFRYPNVSPHTLFNNVVVCFVLAVFLCGTLTTVYVLLPRALTARSLDCHPPWASWPTRGGAVIADPPNREGIHPVEDPGYI